MRALCFGILILFSFQSLAQNKREDVEAIIRNLIPEGEETDPEFLENLIQLYSDPLDLNNANAEDLQSLMMLSPFQIQHFLNYRSEAGALLSLYELQVIPGFDWLTIQQLLPFVKINSEDENLSGFLKDFFQNENKYFLTRYEKRIGEKQNPDYSGDPTKFLVGIRNYQKNNFSIGMLSEKDAGEKIKWQPYRNYYGTDHHSWHVAVFNKKIVKTVLIGDYQVQFGQGLVLGTGFAPGKGGETILSIKKINKGISPHFSTLEYSFLRGCALALAKGPVELTTFYSTQKIDGTIQPDQSFSKVFNGYHRTESELIKRRIVSEKIIGANISIKPSPSLHMGFTGVSTSLDHPVSSQDELYRFYEFTGNTNWTGGADFSFQWKNLNVFGETAISQNKKTGSIFGMIASLSSSFDLSILYRNYAQNFHSFYSNGFSEGGKPQNEKGIYWGIKYKRGKKLLATGYVDFFRFPWLKYQVSAPSGGQEYYGKVSYNFSKTALLYVQAKYERKEKDISTVEGIRIIKPVTKQTFLVHAETSSGIFTFRSKISYNKYRHDQLSHSGFSILQDIDIDLRKFILTTRFALFDAKDFDSRIYVYERDVLYTFSMPFYYGNGIRNYLMLRYKIGKNLDLWLKVAGTRFFSLAQNNQTSSTDKTDFKIQTRYKF